MIINRLHGAINSPIALLVWPRIFFAGEAPASYYSRPKPSNRRAKMGQELSTERELSLDFLRVCEAAAIAAARTMGQGDRKFSNHVAVEAMREVMDTVPMRGRVVIGEGERDEAPMLYIGEEVGGGFGVGEAAGFCPEVDIAVDPLEG